ncbi:UNVERIFIED_CONTAM: hypothetical protein HDU68_007498 [Siphonaria sp. JEL0065]|nr:hypothetical protein HDU68_007498 [Siphonaria sp. JEL0065]
MVQQMAESTSTTLFTTTSANATTTADPTKMPGPPLPSTTTTGIVQQRSSSMVPAGNLPAPSPTNTNGITINGSPQTASGAGAAATGTLTPNAQTNIASTTSTTHNLTLPLLIATGLVLVIAAVFAFVAKTRKRKLTKHVGKFNQSPRRQLLQLESNEYWADSENDHKNWPFDPENVTVDPAQRPSFELLGAKMQVRETYGFGRNEIEIPMEKVVHSHHAVPTFGSVFIETTPEFLDDVGATAYMSDSSQSVIKTIGAAATTVIIPDCPLARAASEKAVVTSTSDNSP